MADDDPISMMPPSDPFTRRRLLTYGGAAAATALFPSAARGARRKPGARAEWFDRESYAARVGETFVMRGDDGTAVAVRLKRVRDLVGTTPRGRSLAGRPDAFVLSFKPVTGAPAGDGLFGFSHPRFAPTQLFAVAGSSAYTVVVNRSVPLSTASRLSQAAVRMKRRKRRRR